MTDQFGLTVEETPGCVSLRLREPLTLAMLQNVPCSTMSVTEVRAWWKGDVSDLTLLHRFPKLDSLMILNRTCCNVEQISSLSNLRVLVVDSDSRFDLDLDNWSKLVDLEFTWNGKVKNLERAFASRCRATGRASRPNPSPKRKGAFQATLSRCLNAHSD